MWRRATFDRMTFEVVAVDPRWLLAPFRRVSELDAEEDWAFLSVVAQGP